MRVVQRAALVLVICVSLSGAAAAQTVVSGYLVAGVGQDRSPANSEATVHVAVGAEGRVASGRLGVGAEIGYLAPTRDLSGGFGVLSPNATLYFKNASRLVPFATAGYSLLFREAASNAFNVGAGVEYWTPRGIGLRLEVRNHILLRSPGAGNHYWVARAGVTSR